MHSNHLFMMIRFCPFKNIYYYDTSNKSTIFFQKPACKKNISLLNILSISRVRSTNRCVYYRVSVLLMPKFYYRFCISHLSTHSTNFEKIPSSLANKKHYYNLTIMFQNARLKSVSYFHRTAVYYLIYVLISHHQCY